MKRSYLFRRPKDDDEEDFYSQEDVKAKPIDSRLAKNLGPTFAAGKDFVRASQKTQNEFYGDQTVLKASSSSTEQTKEFREMTHDEKNNLSASIIKAELKGDKEKVDKLKKRLQEGIIEINSKNSGNLQEKAAVENKSVILMEIDRKSGLARPAVVQNKLISTKNESEQPMMGVIEKEYSKHSSLDEMLAEEKRTSAEDQISMFNRASEIFSKNRQDEEGFFDDTLDNRKKQKREENNLDAQQRQTLIREHKFVERTLDSCSKCIESRLFEKHALVATGLKTYLSVVNFDGLSSEHCLISTMEHYSSCLQLDEDVWEEIQFWMLSLVNMWKNDQNQDCIFFENARDIHEQKHLSIECVPLPREVGDLSPIYFKKAIMESEKEWSVNKKLIDLSKNQKKGVRGLVPKGFPYFAVYFGLQPGYAHIIEKEKNFPANFAQEIIGGMLDLHYKHWKNPKKQSFNEIKIKKENLRQNLSNYDWTKKKDEKAE